MPEWFDTNLVSVLNGLAIGCLLFLLASGLSLVFGMMDVLNLAHGAVFLVGAYAAYALIGDDASWGGFVVAIVAALAAGAVCGGVLAGMTAPLAGRGHLDQALLTLGVALVLADLVVVAFGRDVHGVAAPPGLDGSVSIAGQAYPVYRLALIGDRAGAGAGDLRDRGADPARVADPGGGGGPRDARGDGRRRAQGAARRVRRRLRARRLRRRAGRADLRRSARASRTRSCCWRWSSW